MATRYLKPGICDSSRMDSISANAERLFLRLLVNVDDFGRMDARPAIVKSRCFPLKDSLPLTEIEEWLKELVNQGLVIVYKCIDGTFLQFNKWDNKPRAAKSQFPPINDECIQLYTCAPLTETKTETKTETICANAAAFDATRFTTFWQTFPNKRDKQKALEAFKRLNPDDLLLARMLKAVKAETEWRTSMKAAGEFVPEWKYGQGWINGKRWEDELPDAGSSEAVDYLAGVRNA